MHRLASLRAPLNTAVLGIAGVAGLLWLIAEAAGDTADRYWDPLGLLIVLGGTLAATLIAFRGRHVWSMLSSLGALFEREPTIRDEIETIVRVATLVGRSNVRLAEAEIAKVERPFLRLGLQLAFDGVPVEEIMHVLNWRIQKQVERETAQARLFRTLANFAPALGMLGTLVGLVNMLTVLGSGDLDRIGRGLSVALITTVYGVVLANLVFRPVAIRLEQRTVHRVALMNVLLDGIILMRLGRSPSTIRDTIDTMVVDGVDEMGRRP